MVVQKHLPTMITKFLLDKQFLLFLFDRKFDCFKFVYNSIYTCFKLKGRAGNKIIGVWFEKSEKS